MIVLSFGLFIHFTEESVIEAVDVNGTRELERLPDNFDGRFGCALLLKVFEIFLAKYNCMLTGLLVFWPPTGCGIYVYVFYTIWDITVAC